MALKTYFTFKLPMKKNKNFRLKLIPDVEQMSESEQASDPRITLTINERAKLLLDYVKGLQNIARIKYGASRSEAEEMVAEARLRFWHGYQAKFRMDPANTKEEEIRLFKNYFFKIFTQGFGKAKKKVRKLSNVTAFSLEQEDHEEISEESVTSPTYIADFIAQNSFDEIGLDIHFEKALRTFRQKIADYGFGPGTVDKILSMIDSIISGKKVCWSHIFRSNRFNVKIRNALRNLYLESGFDLCPTR